IAGRAASGCSTSRKAWGAAALPSTPWWCVTTPPPATAWSPRRSGDTSSAKASLHQLADERLRHVRRDAQLAMGERAAAAEHRLQLVEGPQVLALPEEPDGNLVAPLRSPLDGEVQVGRIVPHLVEPLGPLLEEVVGVVVVVRDARAEGVDEGEAPVQQAPLDQLDQVLLLTREAAGDGRRAGRDRQRGRVDRVLDATEGRALRVHPLDAGRRELTGGQPVELVVHDDVGHVDLAAHGVYEVVASDAVSVALAAPH